MFRNIDSRYVLCFIFKIFYLINFREREREGKKRERNVGVPKEETLIGCLSNAPE